MRPTKHWEAASHLEASIFQRIQLYEPICRAVDGESAQTAWYIRRQPTENHRRLCRNAVMIVVGFRLDSPQPRFPTHDPLESRNVHRFCCRGRCVTIECTRMSSAALPPSRDSYRYARVAITDRISANSWSRRSAGKNAPRIAFAAFDDRSRPRALRYYQCPIT